MAWQSAALRLARSGRGFSMSRRHSAHGPPQRSLRGPGLSLRRKLPDAVPDAPSCWLIGRTLTASAKLYVGVNRRRPTHADGARRWPLRLRLTSRLLASEARLHSRDG